MATNSRPLRGLRVTSVRARLILWSVGVMAFVLVVLGVALRWTVEANLLGLVDRELRSRSAGSEIFFGQIVRNSGWPFREEGFEWLRNSTRRPGRRPDPFEWRRPRTLKLDGKPLYPYGQDVPWDSAVLAEAGRGEPVLSTVDRDDVRLRIYSAPLFVRGRVVGVMQTAASLAEVDRDISGVASTMMMLIPLGLLIVAVSAAFLTGRLLRPVRQVAGAAAGINATDLSQRLPVTGGDEFAELSITLNAMLSRLEHSFEQQRRFVADASHELRTPLTAIKAHTSMALYGDKTPSEYRRSLAGLDRSATFMAKIVQDLLHLARSDAGQLTHERAPLPLWEVVEAAAEAARASGEAPVEIDVDPSLRVMGDRGYLVRLFTNLLDNALRHTPADGSVVVRAELQGEFVSVSVRDTGCGIAAHHLPHLCDRFYRVDESRCRKHGGTGLGLAISRSIVEAHGGSLELASEVGKGTTVTVRLPAATPGLSISDDSTLSDDSTDSVDSPGSVDSPDSATPGSKAEPLPLSPSRS